MSRFNKILIGIWACLAILSFVLAFFCPIFPMVIGIAFGTINMIVILTWIISYFQGLYYTNKLQKEIEDELQLQESQETNEEKA